MKSKARRILVFTHAACDPPGYFATWLEREGYGYEHVCLYDGQTLEHDLQDVVALIFMGGPGDVNTPTDWMSAEMALIRDADQQGIPVLGVCLGAQLLCKALGGEVAPGDDLEVGWHPVFLSAAGKQHELMQGLDHQLKVFHWHAHVCKPPRSAQILVTGACTECQAFVLGPHLGLQFHVDMEAETIIKLLELYGSDVAQPSDCVQDADQITENITEKCAHTFDIADRLLSNWFERSVLSNTAQTQQAD